MSQQPNYLSQGVNFLGFLSQQLGDLAGKSTLAHELIQNADDAKDESGKLAATRITFDITDAALVVSNDSVFREIDFDRIRDVAGGSKRTESGDRTTGAFGVGFISVYQVTDRPEIRSTGRVWLLTPDQPEDQRIKEWLDPSITRDTGTVFNLPWAFERSIIRDKLSVPTVDGEYIDSLVEELQDSLPRAALFLKNLERVELRRDGDPVRLVTRRVADDTIRITQDGETRHWYVLEGDFSVEAEPLKRKYGASIAGDRSARVRVAIPDSSVDRGLLYATLPTEQSTGLPFHIDADFYPDSDRKAIEFGDAHDPRSEWNRAAIRAAASTVQANLSALVRKFRDDAPAFWEFLSKIHKVHQDTEESAHLPLAVFWELLVPALADAPIVPTESGKWLRPRATRIPTGAQEEAATRAFENLGLEIVHHDLWRNHRNLLIRRDVGVLRISAVDVYECLKARGYTDAPVSSPPVEAGLLESLWRGVGGVLENEQGNSKATAESLLRSCTLAQGVDGRFWPCGSAFRSDDHTRGLFAPLMPTHATFVAKPGVPLWDHLCPQLRITDAIEILERLDSEELEDKWQNGEYDPVAILQWLEEHKSELTNDLAKRIAALHIFPSVSRLRPLNDLWLPGGFQDPLGEASLLDTRISPSLSSFLVNLGVRPLTFEDYAKDYVPQAFASNSAVELRVKRTLLATLEKHIGQIKDNDQVRDALSRAWIVECDDGVFRQPGDVYFRNEEVNELLGDQASYARVAEGSELRRDFYKWLGVRSNPRPKDILRRIEIATSSRPASATRTIVIKMLEALGSKWDNLDESEQRSCLSLKAQAWLPVESDVSAWYKPTDVFASFNKHLFASQAKFLDAPISIQQNISRFLQWLDVGRSPRSWQVVRHLLECAKSGVEPPADVYRWLNENTQSGDLRDLKGASCLWIQDRYLHPDQVFWGSHPFGKYRVQLGTALRSYQDLLTALEVREKPDFNDAIEVLKDIAEEIGNDILEPEDKRVVIECWMMLSDALERQDIGRAALNNRLVGVRCVPTKQDRLHPAQWMFLEDRPGLASKFPRELDQNCIPRFERAWLAMEASGVRRVSEVVKGYVAEALNARDDEQVLTHVSSRVELIKTILEGTGGAVATDGGAAALSTIRFVRADELNVCWHLEAFNRDWPDTAPQPVSAHWDGEGRVVYFASQSDGSTPWAAVSRELALALAPNENPASISPGLKSVLEAASASDARTQLSELGIASIQTLDGSPAQGLVADSLGGDALTEDGVDQPWTNDSTAPEVNEVPGVPDKPTGSFAARLHGVQTTSPATARHNPIVLPPGGPKTAESAREYTVRAGQVGRTEGHELRLVTRSELGPHGKALADEFRDMVIGDYGKRCQICSKTFATTSGRWQVNVVHVVPPRQDSRTNHFGDLLGLCGWHFNLLQFGQWALLDPNTGQPFQDSEGSRGWERMQSYILGRTPDTDDWGNPFVGLPVRFSNVYEALETEPTTIEEEIRYSIPHWEFLCALLSS